MVEEPHARLDRLMRARSLEIKKRWVQIAGEAGISTSALSQIRKGDYRPSPHTARALDDALEWQPGSIDDILSGGDPTPVGEERTVEDELERLKEITAKPDTRAALLGAIAVLEARLEVEDDPAEQTTLRRLIAHLGGPLPPKPRPDDTTSDEIAG